MFHVLPGYNLCLASTSPRRKRLLADTGLAFSIARPDYFEGVAKTGERPESYALDTARCKAESIKMSSGAGAPVIIAADTVVARNGMIMGKPLDKAQALAMLVSLNGGWHEVYTAVYILLPEQAVYFCAKTAVRFAEWTLPVLQAYTETGECLDKAGAYAIQGQGAFLIDRIDGSWSNVVGLPVARLLRELLQARIIAA